MPAICAESLTRRNVSALKRINHIFRFISFIPKTYVIAYIRANIMCLHRKLFFALDKMCKKKYYSCYECSIHSLGDDMILAKFKSL